LVKTLKFLFFLVILLLTLVVVALIYGLEEKPIATTRSSEQVANAESVTRLIQQLKQSLVKRNYTQNIVATKEQMNSVVGLIQRAKPELAAEIRLLNARATLAVSYSLPENIFGRYINLRFSVIDADQLVVDKVQYGPLTLPGEWFLSLITWVVDWRTNSDIASDFLGHIDRVRIYQHGVFVTLQPIDGFLKKLNEIKNGLSVNQDEPLRQKTAFYLRFISNLPFVDAPQPVSLSRYMPPLFMQVKSRSTESDISEESEAAVLALAIFAGHHRVANMVGEVQPIKGEVAMPLYRPLLVDRTDLTQHFLLSAAIQILSQRDVSMAIGEFKELMDRAIGGSGYSFVDLAADMAGIKLATGLNDPKLAAILVERLIANNSENGFFPDINGLQEGIGKQQFVQRFGVVDSPAYKKQVAEIERRLSVVPVYQTQPE
jgi:hypothetical protein